ncbi:MAG TPA: glycosyltransferase [Thermoanaerobaculia bacterium]|nr:glycosyltransferase [Thermoanaerobaculia bacterium]
MKILFLVERPTQFEAPFFRYVRTHHPAHTLRVLFTGANVAAPAFDPELGFAVDWGIDLLSGYEHAAFPADWRRGWLADELRGNRWDLLVTNGYRQREYRRATALARRLRIATALRLDSDATGSSHLALAAKRLLFGQVLARRYDLFLGVGTRTTDYLERCGVDAARCGRLPYAVDVEHFRAASGIAAAARTALRQKLGVPAAARVVLAVAKLNPREGPKDLVGAAGLLGADVWLLVAGSGPDRDALELAARAAAPERVRFLGYVPYPELPSLYAAADLFVHAAHREHWGVSVAEALACGLPAIVSTGVGAGRDLIEPGQNGFVYRAGDAAELADRIAAALALPLQEVRRTNREVLAGWDYPAAWEGLLAAARQARDGVARPAP